MQTEYDTNQEAVLPFLHLTVDSACSLVCSMPGELKVLVKVHNLFNV